MRPEEIDGKMMRFHKQIKVLKTLFVCGLLGAAVCPAPCAAAQDGLSARDDLGQRLEKMQQEIERLREENVAMRVEIDDLRASTADNWLTEQRAEEIRAIVYDVLADADARTALLGDGLVAGWANGFFLADSRGRFRLEIDGQIQARWMYNFQDDHVPDPTIAATVPTLYPFDADRHRSGFEVARARLTFRGHVFGPDLTYLVRGDFQRQHLTRIPGVLLIPTTDPASGSFHLLDAWMRFHLSDEWSIRVGQFKLPFTREQLVSSSHQLAVERSVIDSRLNIGRSQGIDVTWASGPHRFSGVISDGGTTSIGGAVPLVGGGSGSAMSAGALSPSAEYAVTARYEHLIAGHWGQFEDFTSVHGAEFGLLVGAAIHFQRSEAMSTPGSMLLPTFAAHKWFAYTLDVSVEWGGANAYAAFTHHRFDGRLLGGRYETWGLVVQGGFYVAPKWEMFGRYEYGDWNTRRPLPPVFPPIFDHLEKPVHIFTLGVNYYLDGHDVKWTTDLGFSFSRVSHAWGWNPAGITGWRAASGGNPGQVVLRTQLQLLF